MAEQSHPVSTLDAELEAWLNTTDDAAREVIVEGQVPRCQVRFTFGNAQERQVKKVTTEPGTSRTDVLRDLQEFLASVLGQTPHVLQTAGAIPVRVTRDQLRRVMRHPLVRAVRTNRQLKTV